MADSDKAYMGRKPCGCVVFAMVAGYEPKRSEEAELRRQMKAGLDVSVATVGEIRPQLGPCPHGSQVEDIPAAAKALTEQAR